MARWCSVLIAFAVACEPRRVVVLERIEGARAFAASEDRRQFVSLVGDTLYLLPGPTVSDPCLADDVEALALWPGRGAADRVIAFGARTNVRLDLFGHSGRRVSVACAVDPTTRTSQPLAALFASATELASPGNTTDRMKLVVGSTSGRLYAWREQNASTIWVIDPTIDATVALHRRADRELCAVHEAGIARLVCVEQNLVSGRRALSVFRLDLGSWPLVAQLEGTLELPSFGDLRAVAISSAGTRAFVAGSVTIAGPPGRTNAPFAMAVDLDARAIAWSFRERTPGIVLSVDSSPRTDDVLLGISRYEARGSQGRVQVIGADGVAGASFAVSELPFGVYSTASEDSVWIVGSWRAERVER